MEAEVGEKSRWKIGKESIIPLLLGMGGYIGLEVLFNLLNLPIHTYYYITFAIFPAIAIPIVMGAKYGPIVGFFVGFGGKIIADAILFGGIWIWWPIGIGLMGFIPGLSFHKYYQGKYAKGRNLFRLSLYALLAAFIGTLFPSMLSIFTDQLGLLFPIVFYFIPMFFVATINGVIFAPILGRGLEYLESKSNSREKGEFSSSSPTNLTQIGQFTVGFCFLLSFGLLVVNTMFAGGGHLGCSGVPFGHEIAGDIQSLIGLGIYIFLGIGIALSGILLVRWGILKKT